MKKRREEQTVSTNEVNVNADRSAVGTQSCAAGSLQTELRTFHIDGDTLEIEFRYDKKWEVWLGDYPYFKDEPRFTPSGRPWKNVIHEECPHAAIRGEACGSCIHLRRQPLNDLIGVCFYEGLRLRE